MPKTKYVLDTGDEKKPGKPVAGRRRLSKKELAQKSARKKIIIVIAALIVAGGGVGGYFFIKSRPKNVPPTFVYDPSAADAKPRQVSGDVKISASGKAIFTRWAGTWTPFVVAAESVKNKNNRLLPDVTKRLFWTPVNEDGSFYFRGLPDTNLYFFAFYDRNLDTIVNGVEDQDSISPYAGNPVFPDKRRNLKLELVENITLYFYPGNPPSVVKGVKKSIEGQITCDMCTTGTVYIVGFTKLDSNGNPSKDAPFYVTSAQRLGDFVLLAGSPKIYLYAFWDKNGKGFGEGLDPMASKVVAYGKNPVTMYQTDSKKGISIKIF